MHWFNPPLTQEDIEQNEAMSAVAAWSGRPPVFLSISDLHRMRHREMAYLEAGKLPPNWRIKPE